MLYSRHNYLIWVQRLHLLDFSVRFVLAWMGNKNTVIFMECGFQRDIGIILGVMTFFKINCFVNPRSECCFKMGLSCFGGWNDWCNFSWHLYNLMLERNRGIFNGAHVHMCPDLLVAALSLCHVLRVNIHPIIGSYLNVTFLLVVQIQCVA